MTTTTLERTKPRQSNGQAVLLPLRNGEHLSRGEFERRWDPTRELRLAELIEGIVFMSPPISDTHSEHHDRLHHWLSVYARATPGVKSRIAPSLRLDNRNEYQPDCLLRIEHPTLARSRVSPDGYLEGAPELVAEIAVTSADYDAHEKREVYERLGIQEYLLWQVMDAQCHWLTLEDGRYVLLKPRPDGVSYSQVFPGLWLDLRALLAGDERRVGAVLSRGLQSAEHAAFVRKLAANSKLR
jgi:Uma2 family endonuclease